MQVYELSRQGEETKTIKERKKEGKKKDLDVLRHESNYRQTRVKSKKVTVQVYKSLNGFSPILVPIEGKISRKSVNKCL